MLFQAWLLFLVVLTLGFGCTRAEEPPALTAGPRAKEDVNNLAQSWNILRCLQRITTREVSRQCYQSIEPYFLRITKSYLPHLLFYELRVLKRVTIDQDTVFDLTTEAGASARGIRFTKQREEDGFLIFQTSDLIFSDQRRAIVVRMGSQPSQVFLLPIPLEPKPADWTDWLQPNYTVIGDAGWDFMHDHNKQRRSTTIPPDCFQLRYKIEKWEDPE